MADLFQLESTVDQAAGSGVRAGDTLDTGVLRRKYNFGDRVSELNIAQDPFFRFVSKVAKSPTDDPEFKFTERRPSFHKRYAYVTAWVDASGVDNTGGSAGDADIVSQQGNAPLSMTAGTDVIKVYMATDYKSGGNIQNIFGNASTAINIGSTGTRPVFFLPDQVIKIPLSTTDGGGATTDYLLARVNTVTDSLTIDSRECVRLDCTVVRIPTVASTAYLAGYDGSDEPLVTAYNVSIAGTVDTPQGLEKSRTYVVGSTHAQGSGYPETWKDQPFSTAFGRTQIWKTSMAMDNTTRATVLRYEPNEFARVWKEKLIEHKWDIEQSLLFGSQSQIDSSTWTTQGAIDYVSGFGNVFTLTHSTKTQDSFLDDMSNFLDPRYNNANATLFFCDTATYNWLHKLTGYFQNNLQTSPNLRAEMALTGKKKVFGVDITTISTPYGDMNVSRNIHLDGHPIKLLAINMKYCKYRPLVGNGLNRDTSVYVGVQTLENSGVDRRVDLIQTEAGMEWQMPEAHAYWS